MARKIPAKKHRGVKDPEKQRAKRLTELESRTNAPPKDADEQPIPKSLEHVIKLKEAAKNNNGIVKRKRKKKNALICVGQQHSRPSLHSKARPEKVVPVFQQRPGESGRLFLNRVSRDTEAFLKETAFEKKYGVQIERDPNTGEVQGLTKCKRQRDDVEALRMKHKNIRKRKKINEEESVTLTKNEKRKLKSRLKKENKLQEDDGFDKFQDRVAFGEVAHEPPKLTIKTTKMSRERKPKELLLNSLLQGTNKVSSARVLYRSAKRKKLPAVERKILEKQQSEAIAAYRRLKSQRLANRSS
ncbi:hypothetical protein DMN91_012480 [Ooceraea biroi]|uniref:Coiled-coil domain-containing protein n=1 Tax=Ooceraea biroi TaxID=2015173 RepID=A0A026VVM7_OOCBI|nr:coiled-coil domain-containing protein 137 [Ooceraea biroi]EZA47705.1 Coiled-coil domain-containing protein [Ooceraea biroi]RLU15486.1 hypothetical protein DMN91_012480 [Ooceraea biroi]